MSKKAAIVTYWDTSDNYGTILQNYALQRFLLNHGIEPTTIREHIYGKQNLWAKLKRNLFSGGIVQIILKIFTSLCKREIAKANQKRDFDSFREKNIAYTDKTYENYADLKNEQNEYDFFIAGSDQIWNFGNDSVGDLRNRFKTVFFDFASPSAKKISCAASFGFPKFGKKIDNVIISYIKQFDFVSIRETSGVEYCKKLGLKSVVFQPDPTLLLEAASYRKLIEEKNKPDNKYILLYLLNNTSDFSITKLKKWAVRNNLDIVYVNGNLLFPKIDFNVKTYPTIPEWLALFDNAEFVFTNSFHGSVFSILFNKKFLTIRQSGKYNSQNSRVECLLQQFNLGHRFFSKKFEAVKDEIDFESVNQKLKNIRENSPFVKYMTGLA